MKALIKHFIKYPVLGNAIFVAILLFGLLAFKSMKTTFFPDVPADKIIIQASYPGASPEEIEESITIKIEDKLKGITGIDRMTSTSNENSSKITVELETGYDANILVQEVTNAIDQISSFPVGLEKLQIYKMEPMDFVSAYAIYGNIDLRELKIYARKIERELRNNEGITKITLSGFPEEEIEVSLNEDKLRAYNITFKEIADAVKDANLEITGGKILGETEEFLIRADEKGYYAEELENLVVRSGADGAIVRLRDLADVKDKWSEDPNKFYFNGKPAVNIDINKTNDQDMFSVADRVAAYMDQFDYKHDDIEISLLRDGSGIVKERATILSNNGILGIILVVLFLSFSLNPRMAFWVALAIPISFTGMAILGSIYGLTINVISLMGMIIVIGMLVDDGIVIAENIYQHYEKGEKPIEAAINGTLEVLPSVTAAILTTIVFFSMFLFLEGDIGVRMKDIGFVVIATLAISLVEGVLILPAHIAHSKALHQKPGQKTWIMRKSEEFLHLQRDIIYAPLLKFCIRNPIIIAIIPVALFMITIGALQGSIVKVTFFPVIERDNIVLSFQMPAGTPERVTDSLLQKMEQDVWLVNQEYDEKHKPEKSIIKAVARAIGPNAHQGGLRITLVESQFRDLSEMDIRNMIRQKIGVIPEADRLQLGTGGMWGMPVSVALKSNNLEQLREAKEELKALLKENPKLKDVSDNDSPGLKEIKIKLKEKAYALGLTTQQVMEQVRSGFFGKEAQRVIRGIDEVKIWVRYDKSNRSSLEQMEELRIRLNDGRAFPLKEIADFTIERGVSSINHIDAQRVVEVEADILSANESVTDIIADVRTNVMPNIVKAYPDVSFDFEGQSRESTKTAASIQRVIPIIVGIMFLVVVFTFRSFIQAFIVFVMVPFSLIGVVWGHFIQGFILSLFSMFGTIALIGIVINDSLIFINEFNRILKEGKPFNEALYETGMSRFRPVVLTSITTIAGLGPLMFEPSRQAQFLSPMAVAVAYGLLFGTTLTLVMLPSLLVLFNRLKVYVLWLIKGEKPSHESVEPAIQEEVFASQN